MHPLIASRKYVLAVVAAVAALASLGTAHAGVAILYAFDGRHGGGPNALIDDPAGNFYGTTLRGGGGARCRHESCGIAFKLAPGGTETVLHIFPDKKGDGTYPNGLIEDSAGNLYGTTWGGGAGHAGTAFELAPDGTETVLLSFGRGHGSLPAAGVIRDKAGNLYGTTTGGGVADCTYDQKPTGCGIVFALAPNGIETVLHAFTNGSDGAYPAAGVIRDKGGDLYGTTQEGGGTGCAGSGCGTVFKVAPDGTETVLHAFTGGSDGSYPAAALIEDKTGNLYGTTEYGGAYGNGTAFLLAPDGTETVLHSFTGGSDGANPEAGLIEDKSRNLYGTTAFGGNLEAKQCKTYGCGTVFKLAADGTETVLHAFRGRSDGSWPETGLIKDGTGRLYGTASGDGKYDWGTVFRLAK